MKTFRGRRTEGCRNGSTMRRKVMNGVVVGAMVLTHAISSAQAYDTNGLSIG